VDGQTGSVSLQCIHYAGRGSTCTATRTRVRLPASPPGFCLQTPSAHNGLRGFLFWVGDAFACGCGRTSGVRLHKSCKKPRGPTSPRDCWAHRQCGPDPCRSVPTDGPLKETKQEALQKDAERDTPARSVAASVRRCISGAGRWVGGVKDAFHVATKHIPSPSRPARPLNSLALRGTGGTPGSGRVGLLLARSDRGSSSLPLLCAERVFWATGLFHHRPGSGLLRGLPVGVGLRTRRRRHPAGPGQHCPRPRRVADPLGRPPNRLLGNAPGRNCGPRGLLAPVPSRKCNGRLRTDSSSRLDPRHHAVQSGDGVLLSRPVRRGGPPLREGLRTVPKDHELVGALAGAQLWSTAHRDAASAT